MLSLGMLIEVARDDSQKLFKELVFLSHRMSIQVTFTPVSLPNYEAMVNMQKTSRFTVLAPSAPFALSPSSTLPRSTRARTQHELCARLPGAGAGGSKRFRQEGAREEGRTGRGRKMRDAGQQSTGRPARQAVGGRQAAQQSGACVRLTSSAWAAGGDLARACCRMRAPAPVGGCAQERRWLHSNAPPYPHNNALLTRLLLAVCAWQARGQGALDVFTR